MTNEIELGLCCEIIAGQSPPSTTYNRHGNGLPFFQGKADFGELFPQVRYWCNAPVKIAREGDILISVRAPVGPTNINNVESCIGRGLSAIRPSGNVDRMYLLHYLRSIEKRLADKASGSTFAAITQKDLKAIKIPLPPLPIQQKIAAILDAADLHRQKTKTLIEKHDQLTQSLFLEMFGDPVRNEKGWEKRKMQELMTIVRGGSPRPIDNYLGGTYPWIKIGDATKGSDIFLERTKEHITSEGLSKTRLLPEGSVIFANCGVSLGFARILKFEGCIHDGWLAFSEIDENILNKIFLLKTLNFCTDYFRKSAPSGTQPNLNTSIIKNFEIIVPPIKLQNDFSEHILNIEFQKEKVAGQIDKSEQLFNSLLQRAFKGELVN